MDDKQESKEAAQDEVIDPFDAASGAPDHGPVFAMGCVLNTVWDVEDLVSVRPLWILFIIILFISVVLISIHGS